MTIQMNMTTDRVSSTTVGIFSDLHLGVHQNSSFWHDVSFKWADWFVNEMTKRNIDTVLFLGDFFHYRDEVAVNTLHVGYKILKKFEKFNIYLIPGNHDSFYKEHAEVNSIDIFSGWSNLHILNKTKTIKFGNKTATFVPWGGVIEDIPPSDYIFGHFEINTFKMNGHKVCDKGCNAMTLLNKSRNIFSGHFHLRDIRKYNEGTITYVGNTFEMDFGDFNQVKGLHVLDFNTGAVTFVENTISPKHLKLPISELVKAGISSDLDKQKIEKNIVKIIVDKKVSTEVVEKILTKIAGYKPAVASVEYATPALVVDNAGNIDCDLSIVNIENVMEEFVNLLEIDNKEDVLKLCVEILNDSK